MDPQDHSPPNDRDGNDIQTTAELRSLANPLCVVRGYTQLLQRRLRRGEAIEVVDMLRALGLIDAASRSVITGISALIAMHESDKKDARSG